MNKTKNTISAALLTALSMLIAFSPVKLPVPPPFSVTLASHVPTMLAVFINPWVALFSVVGSCLGFWLLTSNIIIVIRAASHILFALAGAYMLKKGKVNIFAVIVATSLIHAAAEGLIVYILTPLVFPDKGAAALALGYTAAIGTLFHHYVDCAITAPILYALSRAKLISTGVFERRI
ncbi:MAG: ECF transporter S component [Clostridia bacterium]|nr:ECF transporter S component [Clostridia bacterium]